MPMGPVRRSFGLSLRLGLPAMWILHQLVSCSGGQVLPRCALASGYRQAVDLVGVGYSGPELLCFRRYSSMLTSCSPSFSTIEPVLITSSNSR